MGHKIQRAVDTSTNVCKYFVIEERNRICQATNHVWKENIEIRLPQIYHKQIKISACWSKFHYKPSYTPPEWKFSLWFEHLISAPENIDSDYFADFKSINFSAWKMLLILQTEKWCCPCYQLISRSGVRHLWLPSPHEN